MQEHTLGSRRRNVEVCWGERTGWTWPVKDASLECHHALDGAELGYIVNISSYKWFCYTCKVTFVVIDHTKMTGEQVCLFRVKLVQVTRNDCLKIVVSAMLSVFECSHLQCNPLSITIIPVWCQWTLASIKRPKWQLLMLRHVSLIMVAFLMLILLLALYITEMGQKEKGQHSPFW